MNSSLTEIFVCALMAGAMLWIIGKYLDIFLLKKPLKASTIVVWSLYFIYQFYAEYGKGNGSIFMLLLNVGLIFYLLSGIRGNFVRGSEQSDWRR